MEGDIDLQRDNEQLKAIRRGEWTEERLRAVVRREGVAPGAGLRREHAAGRARTRAGSRPCSCDCLEEHYGSLEGCVVDPDRAVAALRNIQAELDRVKDLL